MEILAETGTFYGGSDDNNELPTIEEILYTTLQRKGFTTEDSNPENTVRGVEEVALEDRDGFIDHSTQHQAGATVNLDNCQSNRFWYAYLNLLSRPDEDSQVLGEP